MSDNSNNSKWCYHHRDYDSKEECIWCKELRDFPPPVKIYTALKADPLYDDKFPNIQEDFIQYLMDGEYRDFLDEMNKLNKQQEKIYHKYTHKVACRLSGNPIIPEPKCRWCWDKGDRCLYCGSNL